MDNDYTMFYVEKGPLAFSEMLVIFGLARIIDQLLEAQEGMGAAYDVEIEDQGSYTTLRPQPALRRETVQQYASRVFPAPFISTAKAAAPEGIPLEANYEEQRERRNAYFEARKKGVELEKPHRDWDVFRAINPGALSGYNSLMSSWHIARSQPEALFLLLDLFAQFPNSIEQALERWQSLDKTQGWGIRPAATWQQLYNPDSGKGQNKNKANGLSIGNLDGFWLVEWLKAVGFYDGALTRTMRGAKDRKTFVIAPRRLSYKAHQMVMDEFLNHMSFAETSTRFDILAAVRYCQALLGHLRDPVQRRHFTLSGTNLRRKLVAGFYTAFYKDMGNAVATMNLSFIALPGWITVDSHDDLVRYQELLEELEQLVRQFDESHSDAFTLLQHLRDFVSGDDLNAFFRFTNAFPAYYMGMRERGKYTYRFTTTFVERLLMSTDKRLSYILEQEGFQNIAYAIRQSTVTAQYRKQQGDRKYDVRYGLGQELARKSRYPHEFISILSDFLHKYNAENARVLETRPGPYRRSITTSDIDTITALIDDYGSETVAKLLIAYGYARTPREAVEEPILEEEQE